MRHTVLPFPLEEHELRYLQEALYELVRLHSDLQDRHADEIEQKNVDIAELTDMVEELAAKLRDLEVDLHAPTPGENNLLLKRNS